MRLKTSSAGECRKALSKLVNMTLNEEISCKIANTITFEINAILSALRVDELEQRLNKLEGILDEYEREQS